MFFDKNSKNKIWVTDIWRDYLPCVLYTIHMYLLHLLQFGLPYIHGYKKRTSKQSQWRIPITTLITSLWCRQASKQASKQASEWAWGLLPSKWLVYMSCGLTRTWKMKFMRRSQKLIPRFSSFSSMHERTLQSRFFIQLSLSLYLLNLEHLIWLECRKLFGYLALAH